MAGHPIEGLMQTAMENLKDMIDVNTIIGDPVETPDGSVILTVSKVGFGFAAGGSEFMLKSQSQSSQKDQSKGEPFGGGSGGGVSITPIAFLIVSGSDIKMIHLDNTTHLYERLLDLAPQAIEKIQSMLQNMGNQGSGKDKQKSDQSNQSEQSQSRNHSQSKYRSQRGQQQNDEKQDLGF
ncbi:GerW family sporulation protein [Guptibacillus algicola]|uniref:GerW family sporulation protein n=1 Tax=Guptibacillus algicola TaxID=225844 RepID=UPI001CD1A5EE|nr:GerW family sporulation protein [Alkalihalobacillus algicola]MCA0986360.1 GerW family sporulation protein [Alkalihalobacillus algicola]